MTVALVRFTPGARTNWHRHAVGQTLHITDGVGLVGTRDGQVVDSRHHAATTRRLPPVTALSDRAPRRRRGR
ncbi:hypothetical protein [Geodermatophilus sp. TF02-6]|uniref:hypothetical protein n=1 Tax=Geodermatophilus sp. TF02-6 TaxID=2250575 RepID=UPI0018F7087B|nr:hypothetical protein [Geodermatophilus sp. TF02-6]